jgi:hypothetical protein
MEMADVVALIDATNPVPAVRGPYKKREADKISTETLPIAGSAPTPPRKNGGERSNACVCPTMMYFTSLWMFETSLIISHT